MFFWLGLFSFYFLFTSVPVYAESDEILKVVVVGDTGIGERAFYQGFREVAGAMEREDPDLILHLGDFVYQPENFPSVCDFQYKNDIFQYLIKPFPLHLFVLGDNDLPPDKWKPKASGCWEYISSFSTPFDNVENPSKAIPGPAEGTKTVGNVLFAVLNTYHNRDSTPWLKPRVEKAREEGKWIVLAIHEPPITTAWFREKRQTELKNINLLQPDLVFSGNQHSYERFHQIGVPDINGKIPVTKPINSNYIRGEGVIHIVTGGGGATFKPFADLQGKKKRTAPKAVFDALAVRALMNHYVALEISDKNILGRTERVCPNMENIKLGKTNPRWKPQKKMWKKISLACENRPPGQDTSDRFALTR
tara:strand:- start:794 stop:1882 length:1089 start_codon:yes stop_codon:yes gene_type:complete